MKEEMKKGIGYLETMDVIQSDCRSLFSHLLPFTAYWDYSVHSAAAFRTGTTMGSSEIMNSKMDSHLINDYSPVPLVSFRHYRGQYHCIKI
jgi:hypothetical protein